MFKVNKYIVEMQRLVYVQEKKSWRNMQQIIIVFVSKDTVHYSLL